MYYTPVWYIGQEKYYQIIYRTTINIFQYKIKTLLKTEFLSFYLILAVPIIASTLTASPILDTKQ